MTVARTRHGPQRRTWLAVLASVALVVPLAILWWSSLVPEEFSMAAMGTVDLGGGPGASAHHHDAGIDLQTLTVPPGDPDVSLQLTARSETFRLATGRTFTGYTLNHTSPGPIVRARRGDLVEVVLHNENVTDGVTLHWHGVDVPASMDGVAGVTQDAVAVGASFTYRFVADQVGTYWYHSHQLSHAQVTDGLLGAVVVLPERSLGVTDVVALVHRYGATRTVNGLDGDLMVGTRPGERVRVRVIGTDNAPVTVWVSGAAYRVVAVDGTDVHGPTDVTDRAVSVAAGGRDDLEVTMPADGSAVRVELGGTNTVLLGAGAASLPRTPAPGAFVDLLTYGTPSTTAATTLDPSRAARHFTYRIDRRPGFLRGRPGLWWTVNGKIYPDVPMFMVAEGDVVVMDIDNRSGALHPMHLHGHHAVVLSRNGIAATGSPWWIDSLDVADGDRYSIAFVADNPGLWADHCHNLPHAQQGLITHLMYEGYTTPFVIGGPSHNEPE